MSIKKAKRLRRAAKTRRKICEINIPRLTVFRTPKHIYVQLIASDNANVLTSASSLEKEIKQQIKTTGNIEAATAVGTLIAKRIEAKGIKRIAFDRSGFKYHGRIKALADAARAGGIEF